MRFGKNIKPRARWHSRRNSNNTRITMGFACQRISKDTRIGWCFWLRFGLHACCDIKFHHTMIFIG